MTMDTINCTIWTLKRSKNFQVNDDEIDDEPGIQSLNQLTFLAGMPT